MGYMADSPIVVDIALATIGGIAGFLRYNTHPARVFMGDAGSQFLGFSLSFAIIYLVQVANPATSAALPSFPAIASSVRPRGSPASDGI